MIQNDKVTDIYTIFKYPRKRIINSLKNLEY